eukprot:SAG11_NODE_5910_length_1435_cov_3.466317_1_plen_121_part_00
MLGTDPEHPDQAMAFLEVAIETDMAINGTPDPLVHARAHALRGLLLSRKSRREKAHRSFEASLQVSNACGLWLVSLQILGEMERACMFERNSAWRAQVANVMGRLASPKSKPEKISDGSY